MTTPFSTQNASFTDAAHQAARTQVYPQLFANTNLTYERVTNVTTDARHAILDGELGIDLIVSVGIHFQHPIPFTIQERFRKPEFQRYADLTITQWNHTTDMPSELHKLASDLFVYGYYDPNKDEIIQAIAIHGAPLKTAITTGQLHYEQEKNPRSNQTFIAITFKALYDMNLIAWSYQPTLIQRKEVPF